MDLDYLDPFDDGPFGGNPAIDHSAALSRLFLPDDSR